jgi:CubicO group peptidase (beta-lactamase class C family)
MTPLRHFLVLLCFIPLSLAGCATTPSGIQRATQSLVPALQVEGRAYPPVSVEQQMREHRVPAVSVAFIDQGRIVWTKAWGLADVERGREATPATLFQAGSLSKPLSATAALRMVDAGTLSLDDDVNSRLHTWKVPPGDFGGKVTLRRLLSHTSGLMVSGFPGYPAGAPLPSATQILEGVPPANTPPIRLDAEPGSRWRYSGGGYVVVQTLLSDVGGKPFAEVMREQVLKPAGMVASTFEQPIPAAYATIATGHDDSGKPIAGRHHVYPEMAAAGLWTTPADLARWLLALDDLLTPPTLQAMLTEQKEQSRFGLGIGVAGSRNDPELSHAGANQGFRATFRYLPARRQGVVIMTNGENGASVAAPLLMALAKEYGWPGPKPNVIVPIEVAPAVLEEFTGTWVSADRPLEAAIFSADGKLFMRIGDEQSELVPTAKDVLTSLSGGTLRLERDESGKVQSLVFNGRKLRRKE